MWKGHANKLFQWVRGGFWSRRSASNCLLLDSCLILTLYLYSAFEFRHKYSHTHAHTLSLSLSPPPPPSLSFFLSLSLSLSHTHTHRSTSCEPSRPKSTLWNNKSVHQSLQHYRGHSLRDMRSSNIDNKIYWPYIEAWYHEITAFHDMKHKLRLFWSQLWRWTNVFHRFSVQYLVVRSLWNSKYFLQKTGCF